MEITQLRHLHTSLITFASANIKREISVEAHRADFAVTMARYHDLRDF